jgi:hypothetical protein
MLYRSKIERVLWPVSFMETRSGMPARTNVPDPSTENRMLSPRQVMLEGGEPTLQIVTAAHPGKTPG